MGIGGEWDVIVCGAGMAGLCAGVSATEAGARTLVIEKGSRAGGSMRMSGGTVWTAPNMAVMERFVPGGDRVRQEQLVHNLAPGLEWLAVHGVPLGGVIGGEFQIGREVNVDTLTERMVEVIQANGGDVAVSAALERLDLDETGRIRGLTVREADGRRSTIDTRAVVLATGGFQGNHELLARWVGRYADQLLQRANPNSVGEGLIAAMAIGARTSPNLSTFYGHTMPASPASPEPAQWTSVTTYFSQDAILVNERGERFFDESRSMADELAPGEIVQQPNARAFLLLDDRLYTDQPMPGRSRAAVRPNFDNAVAAGAPNATATTLEGLADALAAWGVSRRGFLATITGFNKAVGEDRGAELRIPRTGSPFGLIQPPYRALAVRPAITFTLGGIDVDPDLRVLDHSGRPIPGLWAAGADAGGTFQGGYMGGLVLGLVQGRIAGRAAAEATGSAVTTGD